MIPISKIYGEEYAIRKNIFELAQKRNQVIYGARAINKQLPPNLRKSTTDYDVLTKKPRESAEELVRRLKKDIQSGRFKVVQAKYPKTFKVKRGKRTIVDYTSTTKKPKSKNVFGIKYANLDYQKKKIKRILKDTSSSYRHEKDLDTLNRIKQSEMRKFLLS